MNNIHLSKSSYCTALQCEKILWLNKYNIAENYREVKPTSMVNLRG